MANVLALVADFGLVPRAATSREFSTYVAAKDPDIIVLYGVRAGEALALATLFALRWGYHRRKAIFCKATIGVDAVHHRFLPGAWWKRSILQVDGRCGNTALSIVAVSVSAHPERRDAQLERFREHIAALPLPSLVLEPDQAYASGIAVTATVREDIFERSQALLARIGVE